jgi:hypothetical protein
MAHGASTPPEIASAQLMDLNAKRLYISSFSDDDVA